jgi:hypothetical protein
MEVHPAEGIRGLLGGKMNAQAQEGGAERSAPEEDATHESRYSRAGCVISSLTDVDLLSPATNRKMPA